MPPRHVYWTILIDKQPTAFRARDREDLLPTLAQLRRTNTDVELKWFARGKLWESPEAERFTATMPRVKRGRDWRPGGTHEDPRQKFKARSRRRTAPAKNGGPPKKRAPGKRKAPPKKGRGPRG
jgi:hypothetical protein